MKSFQIMIANLNFVLALAPGNPMATANLTLGFICLLAFFVMLGVEAYDVLKPRKSRT